MRFGTDGLRGAVGERGLEDWALKRALERARGSEERRGAAWNLEEMRSGLVVAPDGTLERWGRPGIPLGDDEVTEALAEYAARNTALAGRLRAALFSERAVRQGLAPALEYARQLQAIQRYHASLVGDVGVSAG